MAARDRSTRPEAVVFDIGNVLLRWDPRAVYRELIPDEAAMERFLAEVCTLQWHAQHDLGVPFARSCAALAAEHPDQAELIWAWGRRSEEMVTGEIAGTVAILAELQAAGVPCYALTNMEAETYPLRRERFAFMRTFAGTVVSAHEGVIKPDPEIFRRLLGRYRLAAAATVLVDDAPRNVARRAISGSTRSASPHRRSCAVSSRPAGCCALPSIDRGPPLIDERQLMAREIYTAQAHVTGGRQEGHGVTSDGALDVQLRAPTEMGGQGGGTNPEQLFAVGYAACFEGALGVVARRQKLDPGDVSIASSVSLSPNAAGGFELSVGLDVTLPGIADAAQAAEVVAAAHQVCPYSNATRGNIPVTLTANGQPVAEAQPA